MKQLNALTQTVQFKWQPTAAAVQWPPVSTGRMNLYGKPAIRKEKEEE